MQPSKGNLTPEQAYHSGYEAFKKCIQESSETLPKDCGHNKNLWFKIASDGNAKAAILLLEQGFKLHKDFLNSRYHSNTSALVGEKLLFVIMHAMKNNSIADNDKAECSKSVVKLLKAQPLLKSFCIEQIVKQKLPNLLMYLIGNNIIDWNEELDPLDSYFQMRIPQDETSNVRSLLHICAKYIKGIGNNYRYVFTKLPLTLQTILKGRKKDVEKGRVIDLLFEYGKKYDDFTIFIKALSCANAFTDKSFATHKKYWIYACTNKNMDLIRALITSKLEYSKLDLLNTKLFTSNENLLVVILFLITMRYDWGGLANAQILTKLSNQGVININETLTYKDKEYSLLHILFHFASNTDLFKESLGSFYAMNYKIVEDAITLLNIEQILDESFWTDFTIYNSVDSKLFIPLMQKLNSEENINKALNIEVKYYIEGNNNLRNCTSGRLILEDAIEYYINTDRKTKNAKMIIDWFSQKSDTAKKVVDSLSKNYQTVFYAIASSDYGLEPQKYTALISPKGNKVCENAYLEKNKNFLRKIFYNSALFALSILLYASFAFLATCIIFTALTQINPKEFIITEKATGMFATFPSSQFEIHMR